MYAVQFIGALQEAFSETEEAEKTPRKALRMDLRHFTTYIFLGSLLLETEPVQNAISMLKTALIIESDSKTAQERLDKAVEWKNKTTTSSAPSVAAAVTEKLHDTLEADLAHVRPWSSGTEI